MTTNLVLCGLVLLATLLSTPSCSDLNRPADKKSVEDAHGLVLPESSRNFQLLRAGGPIDHGILSMFEVNENDVGQFLAQLKVKSRNPPAKPDIGNPRLNGWNVWPTNSLTFVPGYEDLNGLKRTWSGGARPIEMFSCDSSKGDWLHVEIWMVGDHALVKLYTDWN